MGDITKATTKRPDPVGLFERAEGQAGYFSVDDAARSGYGRALVAYHARRGRFIRIRQGLYRLQQFPRSSREEIVEAWFAARDQDAVVSHETALELLGLADVLPNRIHLTIPRSKRRMRATPLVRIHTVSRPVPREERSFWEGVAVTSPGRTLRDVAVAGLDGEQLELAILQAVKRGLVTPEELDDMVVGLPPAAAERFRSAMKAATE
jgi:predicted transcriptional regulator of viral defense system